MTVDRKELTEQDRDCHSGKGRLARSALGMCLGTWIWGEFPHPLVRTATVPELSGQTMRSMPSTCFPLGGGIGQCSAEGGYVIGPRASSGTESPLCFPTEPISACCSHSSLGELITTRLSREDSRKLAPGFPTRVPYPFAGSVPVFFSLQYIIAVSTTICSVLLANYQT